LKDWNEEILKALAHPIRRSIIDCLREKNALSYSELLECLRISNHGKLGFHMRALKGLVEREPSSKKYRLTDRGQLAGELIWDIRFIISRGGRDLMQEPTRYVRHLGLGDHAFLLFDTEDVKHEITFSFLEAGLTKTEAVMYLVSESKLNSESREIQKYGISADYFEKEAITLIPAEEWYVKKSNAQPKRIIANFCRFLKDKQKAEFTGIRVAAEMDVFIDGGKSKELLEYETTLGRQLTFNACALCLYDTKKIDENQIIELTKCHGHLISKDISWKIV